MKATYLNQLSLLELKSFDQRESALRHARDSHPAHGVVRELAGRLDDLKRAVVTQGAAIADIERDVQRSAGEIERVSARRAKQQSRIDSNQVPLRDINAMEHEIVQMDKRLSALEDEQLDGEERLEAAKNARQAMIDEAKAIAADIEKTKQEFAADVKESDDELRDVIAKRRALAESLPEDLVGEYERVRANLGALAIFEVRNGVGIGMAVELSPAELEQIRLTPEDQLYWTEDTGAIVVRTTQA
ncbi:zinc ribbon domain-containing protein [Schaalia turicensis]|uniref:zinc ribbon domain-containing protein n=1 Tax=Schaalia turicensis TaxID=131111 RepID=UPI0034A3B8AE